MSKRRWTLDEAVTFLHDLQAHLRTNKVPYYVGLSGSVLYGETRTSEKDIDVVVYPSNARRPDEEMLN